MKTFRDALKHWNSGIERGAQTRLAKVLGVKPNTVSQWASGQLLPGEAVRQKLARELGIPMDELLAMFPRGGMVRESSTTYGTSPTLSDVMARLDDFSRRIAALERGPVRPHRKPVERGGQ